MKDQLNKFAKSLRQGQTIYKVYAFPDTKSAYIEKVVVAARPYEHKFSFGEYSTPFMKISKWSFIDGRKFFTEISLKDAGILPNNYNSHRTFTSERKAKAYVEQVRAGIIQCNTRELFEGDDYEF